LPETSIRAFVEDAADPKVRGFLHVPSTTNGNALVLTHGAGSNAQAPLLVALAEAFCASGFTILRCDLPYRQSRPYGPPGPGDAARDRAGLRNAIAAVKKTLGAPRLADFARRGDPHPGVSQSKGVYLAGHSYGGRQSSILCAELADQSTEAAPDFVSGLLLLSYPLHPPRRPEQLRTQHLPNLRTPALFVHGTRDPFGSIAEMEQALKIIPAKTKLLPIEGTGHDLGFRGKTKHEGLAVTVLKDFQTFTGGK
jgi:predicted alpha/beta-hydrolase family hydrolase